MNKQKHLFVAVLCVIFIFCYIGMNFKYDRLSRYPYSNAEEREIIDAHLSDEEIEYIIEYSIAPSVFIQFIDEDGFNIYHAAQYQELSRLRWNETPANIVKMVEQTMKYMDVIELNELLYHYTYDELIYVLENTDPYNPESVYSKNAGSMTCYLDDNTTIGIREPQHLEDLTENISSEVKEIKVEKVVNEALDKMCEAFNSIDEYSDMKCGGLSVESGYISYGEQTERYEAYTAEHDDASSVICYPGHSEHQLGLAIDLTLKGLPVDEFYKTPQYEWLCENAYLYGFIFTYTEDTQEETGKVAQPYHLRYVGKVAQTLQDDNITLKQYNEK